MSDAIYGRLLDFLGKLEQTNIFYTLGHARGAAIMVTIVVPGEHLEVEFLDDGSVEVERFVSTGRLEHEEALVALLEKETSPDDV